MQSEPILLPLPTSRTPLLVFILGPTGSGKTALALRLAQRFQGEIVSCDSVAVYRGMELGTAKPSAVEQALVPHHLLDMVDPSQTMTAGDWARAARAASADIAARGRQPIVAGGTGLYLRALIEGLAPLPARCPSLRARLGQRAATHPPGYLHRMLQRLDPPASTRIHARDTPKLIRALEIALLTASAGAEPPPARDPLRGFRLLRLGLAPVRAALYARINQRAAAMFAGGLVEEVRALEHRYGRAAPALGSLGYREAAAVLAGTLSEAEAIAAAQQGHRNYAKRQMTWFRREPDVTWFEDFGDAPGVATAAAALVAEALAVSL